MKQWQLLKTIFPEISWLILLKSGVIDLSLCYAKNGRHSKAKSPYTTKPLGGVRRVV